MNVLIVLGHPRTDSLCGGLARAYREGALEAGLEVRELALGDLEFDPHVRVEEPSDQRLEPDLREARAALRWADHLALFYPNWWGTMPALLKGFFDRTLTAGFAFSFYEEGEGAGHEKLLEGKTAELIVTMDTPGWVYRFIQRRPGTNAVKRATLDFVGVRTTRTTAFGPVRESTPDQRQAWIERARGLGRSLTDGPEPTRTAVRRRLSTWLGALRLQFYPMAWVAYTVGALAATGSSAVLATAAYWIGLCFLCFLEAATVLHNEYADYETDRVNTFAGPFTGGSRVLVEGDLSFAEVRAGIVAALVLAGTFGVAAAVLGDGATLAVGGVALALSVLALGYTLPPLELSYRTLGELDVAATHTIGVILLGYVLAGGAWTDPRPWLLGLPFFLAVLPSITLAGVPDLEADRHAEKETIAVRFGVEGAATVAKVTTLAAAGLAITFERLSVVDAYGPLLYATIPHALLVYWLVRTRLDGASGPRRIDGLMIASLTYLFWFGVVPLLELL